MQSLTSRHEIESQLAEAIELANLGYWIWSIKEDDVYVSPELLAHLGQSPGAKWTLATFRSLLHLDDIQSTTDAIEATLLHDAPYAVMFRLLHSNGTYRSIESRGKLYRDEHGNADRFVGVHLDATDRLRAQEKLKQTQFALDHANDAIYWINYEGDFVYVNHECCNRLGYSKEELLKMNVFDINTHDVRSSWPLLRDKVLSSDGFVFELEHRRRNGESFPCEISANAIRQGDEWIICAYERDLTIRKAQERALMQRSRDLEDFAHAASHDLQEPLRAVAGYCEILATEFGQQLGETGQKFAAAAKIGANRMQVLVRDLMRYASITREQLVKASCCSNSIVKQAIDNLKTAVERYDAKINVAALPNIYGDKVLLELLVQNLLGNAMKFSKPNVQSVIQVTANQDDQFIHLSVADNGIGIESKHFESIFNVFSRLHTQDSYEGTGIGLAICKRIAELHGAQITVTSKLGVGSTFTVSFPLKIDTTL
jgi:PAS domain S-box-containing protein